MVAPQDRANTASIVELSRFRRRARLRDVGSGRSAELLSMRRSLAYQGSIEIDDVDMLLERLGEPAGMLLVRRVRQLLDREFGRKRVHRRQRHFIARHRSMDTLIAGLLRAQFHALGMALPLHDRRGERLELRGITLTWGVGRSGRDADWERLRRRREKQQSRQT